MATVGNTNIEASFNNVVTDQLQVCGPWVAGASGTVDSISIYCKETSGSSGNIKARFKIFVDNASAPGALVGYTNEVTLAQGAAAAWLTGTAATSFSLVNGTSYWIGVHGGPTVSCVFTYAYNSSGGPQSVDYNNATTYGTTVPDPFPSPSSVNWSMSAYATYATAPAGTHTGSLAGRLELQGEIVVENIASGGTSNDDLDLFFLLNIL